MQNGRMLDDERLEAVKKAMADASYGAFRVIAMNDPDETVRAYRGLERMLVDPAEGYAMVKSVIQAHPVDLCDHRFRPLAMDAEGLPTADELGWMDRLEIAGAYNDDSYIKVSTACAITNIANPTARNLAKNGWVRSKGGEDGEPLTLNLGDLLRYKMARSATKS